ncbi:MAG: SDR family oxidoreductase [Spirochaetaceae bacterium]|nr:MAG: SDR family oxidoreductase [Spirochaetaceae bacterium]
MQNAETSKTALITGASSGIGLELARVFAEAGYQLFITARRTEQLEALANELRTGGTTVRVFPCDLTDRAAVRTLFRSVQETGIPVDVLVNNAGFGDHGEFVGVKPEKLVDMIELNVTALTYLTRLVLPGMLERRHGRILNVASVASFQPGPLMAVYYATKAYVLSLSEALAEELSPSGVTVTALCPGPTASGFQEEAGLTQVPFYQKVKMPSSRVVAEFGFRAMMRGTRVAVHGTLFRISIFFLRFMPRRLVAVTVRRLQERRRPDPQ